MRWFIIVYGLPLSLTLPIISATSGGKTFHYFLEEGCVCVRARVRRGEIGWGLVYYNYKKTAEENNFFQDHFGVDL